AQEEELRLDGAEPAPDLRVVGERGGQAHDGVQLVDRAVGLHAGVVLADASAPEQTGITPVSRPRVDASGHGDLPGGGFAREHTHEAPSQHVNPPRRGFRRSGCPPDGAYAAPRERWASSSARMRRRERSTYSASASMPMKRRPSATAATPVVPEPQKGSRTIAPGSEEQRMMRS